MAHFLYSLEKRQSIMNMALIKISKLYRDDKNIYYTTNMLQVILLMIILLITRHFNNKTFKIY